VVAGASFGAAVNSEVEASQVVAPWSVDRPDRGGPDHHRHSALLATRVTTVDLAAS